MKTINKKFIKKLVLVSLATPLMSSCFFLNYDNKVRLIYRQRNLVNIVENKNNSIPHIYFSNNDLCETVFEFNRYHYLTKQELEFTNNNVQSVYTTPSVQVPSETPIYFFLSINESTGEATRLMRPCILTRDLVIYYALY